ncbi:MAG: hypothetical protein ABJF10_19855 [Chthoniobacter sp.]|uniref:hypothetical protein n=1 Tax=Chthoniobacter sp. TaxID=2510640 RepID=UPI0032A348A8
MKFIPIPACIAMLLQGCSVAQPDFTPIGDGLKAIGISLVVFGVMKVLVDLVRADDQKQKKSQPSPKSHKARGARQPGGGEA